MSTEMHGWAVVDEPIEPNKRGRVRFDCSWWPARCEMPVSIKTGEVVCVVGRSGLTLLVERVDSTVV